MTTNTFIKSHGLGNDYIVLDSDNIDFELTPKAIIRICDEHFGIGSDGILLKVDSDIADFGLRIFNPDASEAENCGNGLRIFSKFLHDYGYLESDKFTVDILGRLINAEIIEKRNGRASVVRVDMGKANFVANEVPIIFDKPECVGEILEAGGEQFKATCVSMGNPHCVVLVDELDVDYLLKYGPQIQALSMFPNGTNVQFAKVLSRSEVEIRIYERGAGYTLASGSSSCGVAASMVKNGLVDKNVKIIMPGGELLITVEDNWNIIMQGPVRQVCDGVLSPELIEDKNL